ncbi:TonB-dependent receptor [Pedobacter nyackensis]|uniref:TonB-linked outer membrane protein, SusC/RagA family n=1 Tax=Pedobacter nyackensis TaxID=475255 RepID=A0A1W2EU65_9SPHI|nr:TonB-dependent receptor [Pedobacter nyackensis]SMD13260.1 TonB-linked outer membrane protein, SusC/RagA family [Pedobacter nyackensis]
MKFIAFIPAMPCAWRSLTRKIIMVINLTTFFMIIALMQVSAKGFSQVSLNAKNASLEKIFKSIEKQTDYVFFSKGYDLNKNKININVSNVSIEAALAICFEGLPLIYKISDKTIMVRKRDEEKPKTVGDQIVAVTISGRVVDEKGGPLIGVSIKVKHTKQGTITDSNGAFRLSVGEENATLLFSFIGFTAQEVPLNGRVQLNIVMLEDNSKLSEVVVVGYGTQKKINLTAAIDVVSGEQLENRPAPNVALLLQGLSPNLNISLNSFGGEPGATQSFQIRGVGSISSNARPLILVDGVEANINYLDPQTIESVSVLKDASAGAVYGSRAAFGVVLITTKRGAKNQPVRVEYSNNTSFSAPIYIPGMESSLIYATAFNQAAANAKVAPVFPAEQVERIKGYINGTYKDEYNRANPPVSQWRGRWDGNANYNWTKEYYKKYALHQKHNVNLSGGGEKSQYYVNAGLFDQPGAYSWGDDGYKRYNILANLTTQVNNWMSFNFSTKYARDKTDVPLGVVGLPRTYTWSQFTNFWPTMPKYNVDGSIANPIILALEKGGRIVTENHDLWMNIGAELEPIKGWKTNISYKYNYQWGVGSQNPKPVPVPVPNGTIGNIGESVAGYGANTVLGEYNLISAFSSYEKQLAKHYIKGLVGYERDLQYNHILQGSKMNLITEEVPSIRTALGDMKLEEFKSHSATEGIFGRINYNFDEKYLLEFSARYNGSSRFAPDLRWGFFPSFSAGYNVSKENFWNTIEPYVNTLKLRGSYGALGNQNVDNYLYLSTIPIAYRRNADNFANPGYLINNEVPLYAQIPRIVSDKLTWETITTLNFGVEAGFFKNRLNIVFDWYNRVTSDMIGVTPQVPSVLGTGVPLMNNAKLSTKGFELSLAWQDRISDNFSYNAKFTLGDSKTTILEYLNAVGAISGWHKGKVHGDVWGFTTDRIIQNPGEAMPNQSLYGSTWGPGDIIYKDLDNNGVINKGRETLDDHGDLSIIANTSPRYNFGITAGFKWKNLDFNMFWQGIGRREFLPHSNSEYFWGIMGSPNSSAIFSGGKMLDYWRPADETNMLGPNTDAYFPKPYFSFTERGKNVQDQSRYVLNAAYLRLKNLQIGYTVPPALLKRLLIQRARFYVSAENLLTFSKLPKMYEPETSVAVSQRDGNGDRDMGEIYPINQMFSLGVNLSF